MISSNKRNNLPSQKREISSPKTIHRRGRPKICYFSIYHRRSKSDKPDPPQNNPYEKCHQIKKDLLERFNALSDRIVELVETRLQDLTYEEKVIHRVHAAISKRHFPREAFTRIFIDPIFASRLHPKDLKILRSQSICSLEPLLDRNGLWIPNEAFLTVPLRFGPGPLKAAIRAILNKDQSFNLLRDQFLALKDDERDGDFCDLNLYFG